jgi:hypothetical protein
MKITRGQFEAEMENEVVVTRSAKIWLGEDGIVRSIEPRAEAVTLAYTKEIFSAILKVSKGKKRPFLADIRKIKSVDRESREYFASEEVSNAVSAIALLVSSPVSKVIGNFYMRLNNPVCPTKLFTSESEAIEWLKGFIE